MEPDSERLLQGDFKGLYPLAAAPRTPRLPGDCAGHHLSGRSGVSAALRWPEKPDSRSGSSGCDRATSRRAANDGMMSYGAVPPAG